MDKWNMVKLSDVFTLQMGKTPSRNNPDYWNGNHKWLSIADFGMNGKYINKTKECITDAAVAESGIKATPHNTVVMSFKLSIGKTAITVKDIFTNEAIMSFIDKGTYPIDVNYIYHLFSGKDWSKGTNKAVMGTTLNKATLSQITIPLPPIESQYQIADNLEKVSKLIDICNTILNKLDILVKSRFVEMFGDPVSNPMNWNKVAIGKHCHIITGNTPPRANEENYGSFIEWIKSDNINTPDTFLTKAGEYLSKKGASIGRCVESGSILMTCIAGSINCIGNVGIANRKVAFNQQINAIVPKFDETMYIYWLMILSKPYIQSTINMSLKGILSKGQLSVMDFPFPPLNLQRQFADFVEQTDKSKYCLVGEQILGKAEMLIELLNQEYFG